MDAYEKITESVIEQMSKGIIPWHKPYNGINGAMNFVSRKHYSLLNQFMLSKPGEYLTPKQAIERGGDFKGAKTETIYFYKMVEKKNKPSAKCDSEDETNDGVIGTSDSYPILKSYNVLHISAVKGIDSKLEKEVMTQDNVRDSDIDDAVRTYLTANGITLEHTPYTTPSYSDTKDAIYMPHLSQFESTEAYYAEMMRVMALSAAREGRCGWNIKEGESRERYSRMQLAAEMTAVMLCNHFELDTIRVFDNSVAAIQKWTNALKADKHMITWAAAKAEKTATYILQTANCMNAAA